MPDKNKYDKPFRWPFDGDEGVVKCKECMHDIYFRLTKKGHKVAISFESRILHRTECPGKQEFDR